MRLLLATPGYPPAPGGVERHVAAVSAALRRRGHSVTVVTLDPAVRGVQEGDEDGIRVLRVGARSTGPFLWARGLVPTLSRLAHQHDLVHAHNYHSPVPLAALAPAVRAAGRPIVLTPHYHGGGHDLAARVAHPVYRAVFARRAGESARVVCVSVAERERFTAAFPDLAARAVVVPNAPRTLIGAARADRAAGPTGDRFDSGRSIESAGAPLILTVSRLEPYKRVGVLLEALARVPGRWDAVVVGAGPQRAELRRRVTALGLVGRVEFRSGLSDATLDGLLLRASVVVQPSSRESFGMAVLDGLAAGRPVIASDLPAHREVAALAGGGVTSWPAHEGPAALAALITEHLVAGAVAAPLPRRGTPLPTWDRVAALLENVYASALSGRVPGRQVAR